LSNRAGTEPDSDSRRLSARSVQSGPALGKPVEEEINFGDAAVQGNDEISAGDRWRLTWAAFYPFDSPALPNSSGSAIG
jgi:hypothetical protein